jgi:hypothetical protein
MHSITAYISALPWWAPGLLALAPYWLPKFLLWPFHKIEGLSAYTEVGQNFAMIMFIPFYLVYILSKTVEQLAELVVIVVGLGSVVYFGGAVLFMILQLGELILFPGETLGLGKYRKTKIVEDWEADLDRQWFHVVPGFSRKREGSESDGPSDTDLY